MVQGQCAVSTSGIKSYTILTTVALDSFSWQCGDNYFPIETIYWYKLK
jgi:hypothetical protein